MKSVIVSMLLFLCSLLFPLQTSAQQPTQTEFYKARVIRIVEEGQKNIGATKNLYQKAELQIMEGPDKDKQIIIEHGGMFTIADGQKINPEDIVIISKTETRGQYRITDKYRLQNLLPVIAAFFMLIAFMAGKKGLGSILGMIISLAVIFYFIIPQILNGADPLLISLLGSIFIMVTTIYLAHGFSQQTTIAIAATTISLLVTILLSILLVNLIKLSGLGSEDIYSLAQGFRGKINFQGLLLGGIIIGALGVLDDITTTQTATVYALADANPKYTVKKLFSHGMKIGREHITSLVNTLVLAYAGASIGVFIFLILGLQQQTQPLWVILNSEFLVEEIVRTLVGSITLILAVPITTIISAFFSRYSLNIN